MVKLDNLITPERKAQLESLLVPSSEEGVGLQLYALRTALKEVCDVLEKRNAELADLRQKYDALAVSGPDPGFGVDPDDSAALLKLRQTIDDFLEYPCSEAEHQGDYEAAVRHAAHQIAAARHVRKWFADQIADHTKEQPGDGLGRDITTMLGNALETPWEYVPEPVASRGSAEEGGSGG